MMKVTVYVYWTNFLQPEDEPHLYPTSSRFDDPPDGWVYVSSAEVEVVLPPRELMVAEAVGAIDKKIEELRAECQEKVMVLEVQKMKFLALEV